MEAIITVQKRNISLVFLILIACFTSACRNSLQSEAVKTAYIHKYGVPVDKEDWEVRGRNGQIITTRKDGVIVAKNYIKGILEGTCSYTFPHSFTIAKEETYDNGTLVSETFHYLSGVPKEKIEYLSAYHIITTHWYENGNPQFVEETRSRLLTSAQYFANNNQIEARVEDGEGLKIKRDEFGELISKDNITKGQLYLSTTYYRNGDPRSLTYFKDGSIHGLKKNYLMGGIPSQFEEWKNGVQQGITITFKNGIKYSERPFLNGKKHGMEQCFKDGKDLVQEISWKYDKRHGSTKTFVENVTTTQWYLDDKLVSKAEFDLYTRN